MNEIAGDNVLTVGPTDAGAVASDVTAMSQTIKPNSQALVVVNNPYIATDAGGQFTMSQYLPEVAKVTEPGGSNKLGVPVMAPTDTLFVFPTGKIVIGPNQFTNSGQWKTFFPIKPNSSRLPKNPTNAYRTA